MLKQLNQAQQIAVEHGEGPMLVLAGPGSGKTHVITSRISHLITSHHINPGNILVITFTREAAVNMQQRFQTVQSKSCPVNFGTFHSCFYQILKRSGSQQVSSVLNDSEKTQMMIPLIKELKKEMGQTNYPDNDFLQDEVKRCLSAISYYKNTLHYEKASAMLEEPYRSHLKELLERYEKRRLQTGKMDFDDMLYQCLKYLREDNGSREKWQRIFQYILIDEFQDCNPMQYEILKMLGGKQANLFAVGDDDQSIYGFRGSCPDVMKQFTRDYPQCKKVLLNINYRSAPDIVQASLKVIGENKNRFPKQLKAAAKEIKASSDVVQDKAVIIESFTEKNEQYEAIINEFLHMDKEEWPQNAILFRTNSMMQAFAARLLKAGIPYVMKEKARCIYDHFIMKDISCYFRLSEGGDKRSDFLRIMNKPYRGIQREALPKERITFEEIREYYRQQETGSVLAQHLIQLGNFEDGIKRLHALPPYLALVYLRKGIGYDTYLKRKASGNTEKLSEWMELLEQASEELKAAESKKEWLEDQEHFIEKMQYRNERRRQDTAGVQLMTVHASKGLEFHKVWIPDVNEGCYPHGRILTEETAEEERRLFYVAMTRAKYQLNISYVTGSQDRPKQRSRFLNSLS